ncbi:MAG: MFS transporter [archaeon]
MKLFQKGELKLLWPFYLDSIISPLLYFYPLFLIIYLKDLGFSLFQIGILAYSAPATIMLVSEIPTGAIADLYGRKFSVILGNVLTGVFFLLMFFTTNYYALLSLSALIGFSLTFNSGAYEAWATDLIRKNKKNLLQSFFVKTRVFDSAALIFSGLIGVVLVGIFGTKVIFPITAASFFIATVLMIFAKENYKKRRIETKDALKEIKQQSSKAIKYSYKNKVIFYFLIASAFVLLATEMTENIASVPFLQDLGLPDYAFGYVWSGVALMGVIAPLITQRFYAKNRERTFIITTILFAAISLLIISLAQVLAFALLLIFLNAFFDFARKPAERIYFQKFIPSKLRASIGSVESMFLSVISIIAAPIGGLLVDTIGSRHTILISSIILIPAIIVFSRIKEN